MREVEDAATGYWSSFAWTAQPGRAYLCAGKPGADDQHSARPVDQPLPQTARIIACVDHEDPLQRCLCLVGPGPGARAGGSGSAVWSAANMPLRTCLDSGRRSYGSFRSSPITVNDPVKPSSRSRGLDPQLPVTPCFGPGFTPGPKPGLSGLPSR